jgi:hypothetical protein
MSLPFCLAGLEEKGICDVMVMCTSETEFPKKVGMTILSLLYSIYLSLDILVY